MWNEHKSVKGFEEVKNHVTYGTLRTGIGFTQGDIVTSVK